jgi:hypothetical protein
MAKKQRRKPTWNGNKDTRERIAQELEAIAWSDVEWTPFREVRMPENALTAQDPARAHYTNSRYQVAVWPGACALGKYFHLSIKTHDRSPRHDWRDLQRIKNELIGSEFYAIEIFPAESRLVDAANQYHLYAFERWVPPVGFRERLIADGDWQSAKQRPFVARPDDCMDPDEFDRHLGRALHPPDPWDVVSDEISRRLALDSSVVVRQYRSSRESLARIQGGDGVKNSKDEQQGEADA